MIYVFIKTKFKNICFVLVLLMNKSECNIVRGPSVSSFVFDLKKSQIMPDNADKYFQILMFLPQLLRVHLVTMKKRNSQTDFLVR